MDSNSAINLRVVNGIIGVALVLSAGAMILGALKLPTPEWVGNAVLSIMGGLVGFISNKQSSLPHPVVEPAPEPEPDPPLKDLLRNDAERKNP